ncbi:Endonuclease III [Entamoeba marina]
MYELIRSYIKTVDDKEMDVMSYGAENIYEMAEHVENKPFYAFIGTYLSPQTRDRTTFAAVQLLHNTLGELTPEVILNAPEKTIIECVKSVGFYSKKVVSLRTCCEKLVKEYSSKVPNNVEELTKLPGVGYKIASLICSIAYNKIEAIAVDTHVFVITTRLGLAKGKTAETVRKDLQRWLPKKYWKNLNKTFVAFGQCVCRKVQPKCRLCPLQKQGLCAYYKSLQVKKNPKTNVKNNSELSSIVVNEQCSSIINTQIIDNCESQCSQIQNNTQIIDTIVDQETQITEEQTFLTSLDFSNDAFN